MWGKNLSLFQDTWRSKIFSIVDIFEEDLVVLQNTDKVNVNLPDIPIHSFKVRFLLKISLKQYMYKLCLELSSKNADKVQDFFSPRCIFTLSYSR